MIEETHRWPIKSFAFKSSARPGWWVISAEKVREKSHLCRHRGRHHREVSAYTGRAVIVWGYRGLRHEGAAAAWLTLLWQVRASCSVLVLFPRNISFNWSSPSRFVALVDEIAVERDDTLEKPLYTSLSAPSTCSGNEIKLGFPLLGSGLWGGLSVSLQRDAEISHSGRMYMLPCPARPSTREAEKMYTSS